MIARSIFFRQVFSHVAVIIFMALTLSLSVMYFVYKGNLTEKEGDLTARVNNIAAFFTEELKAGYIPDMREWQLASNATGAVLWLEDANGQIIQGMPPNHLNPESYKVGNPLNHPKAKIVRSPEMQNAIIISVPVTIADKPGQIIAYYTVNSIHLVLERITRFYFFPFIVGLVAAFLLAMLLSRQLTRSIADIASAAKRFSAGDYTSRTHSTGKDEIGALGKTFNAMADAIFHTQQTRRNFFANISHELKTPLSCVKATTEALIDGIATNDQERTQYLERVLAETDRMSRLVHDITDTEQLESGKMFIKQEPIDLAALLLNQADKIEPLLKKKNLSLLLRVETDKHRILGDAGRLEQVLDNLMSNAIRYAPAGSRIGLILTEENEWLQVCVSDQGEGIADEELPLIWERFYRIDKSRDRSAGGSGLGLSISRGLMEAMGGTISVQSKKGEGTSFKIHIPWQRQDLT
ncbi:sensor histidine kinase [Sporomusa malonica]|uniref:histidine kinase n=1 Tax=Sporomusa malonica TaxID=112901 RepID=A0A1W1YC02_9FIRM|nr:HAMP domain-containing sensor histidine kinase [Sporomusa malonica]SMC33687.1 His Kinase A (phospho-acceptor) domain-containing protein [Sporomusa malonica]